MEELFEILRIHAARYPEMGPTDAVKLVYQNTFGGGHLIRDEEACRNYLRQEYENTPQVPGAPLWEAIGNGIVRVNLAALQEDRYPLEQLAADFIRSAREHTGSVAAFEEKLAVLRRVTQEGIFAFTPAELEGYLEDYKAAGYPPVSHSPAYRAAYAPAYRVILRTYLPK